MADRKINFYNYISKKYPVPKWIHSAASIITIYYAIYDLINGSAIRAILIISVCAIIVAILYIRWRNNQLFNRSKESIWIYISTIVLFIFSMFLLIALIFNWPKPLSINNKVSNTATKNVKYVKYNGSIYFNNRPFSNVHVLNSYTEDTSTTSLGGGFRFDSIPAYYGAPIELTIIGRDTTITLRRTIIGEHDRIQL